MSIPPMKIIRRSVHRIAEVPYDWSQPGVIFVSGSQMGTWLLQSGWSISRFPPFLQTVQKSCWTALHIGDVYVQVGDICNFNGGVFPQKSASEGIETSLDQALAMMLVGTFSQSELDLHFCCVQDEVVEARFAQSGAVEKLCKLPCLNKGWLRLWLVWLSINVGNVCFLFLDKHILSENSIALPDCNFPKVVSHGYIFLVKEIDGHGFFSHFLWGEWNENSRCSHDFWGATQKLIHFYPKIPGPYIFDRKKTRPDASCLAENHSIMRKLVYIQQTCLWYIYII